MEKSKPYKMVQECVKSYRFERQDDRSAQITIVVPARFADLWLVKLSELETTLNEIHEFEPAREE